MAYGAGVMAARRWGAAELVDPRRFAAGSLKEVYAKYPHIGPLLPAMGYGPRQLQEMAETIRRAPCDLVLVATPIDLGRVIALDRPSVRVTYEIEERTGPMLADVIREFVAHNAPLAV
jgi:predicted GTPase